METFKNSPDAGDELPRENPRAILKAAESKEEKEKIERQMLSRQYREVQMKIIDLRESLSQGIQSINVSANREDPQAEAFRNGLINLGRKINDEIEALEREKAELQGKIEAMGGDVSGDTLH
jgi:predicted RNase H-like nuclease (RuvC/YqgF family)